MISAKAADEKLLTVSASPHVRSATTSRMIMLDVIISLCPALIASVLIFGIGAWLIIQGEFTLGSLTTIASYFNMLQDPINFFMWLGER